MNDLQKQYEKLNNSYKKKIVFHLGAEAGFFSEYNNMILAMLYCLTYKIQFVLYSKDAIFGNKEGWKDYFLPFVKENKKDFNEKYNRRQSRPNRKLDRIKAKIYKILTGIDYFTYDLWPYFHNREMEKHNYFIPELGINGNLQEACATLIKLTWNYNAETEIVIKEKIKSINLTEEYIGFHIRSGDKFIEAEMKSIEVYMNKAKEISQIKNIFVLTDDYRLIELLKKEYSSFNFYTFCKEDERGYFHGEFQKNNKDQIRDAHLNLFASIDVLSGSKAFVGTFSSNPGMYLGMRMAGKHCYGVDLEQWQIW